MKQIFLLLAKRLKSKIPNKYKYVAWGAGVIGLAAMVLPTLPISIPVVVVALLPTVEKLCAILIGISLLKTDDKTLIKETKDMVDKTKTIIKNINKQSDIKK